jgi:hypothetical protein
VLADAERNVFVLAAPRKEESIGAAETGRLRSALFLIPADPIFRYFIEKCTTSTNTICHIVHIPRFSSTLRGGGREGALESRTNADNAKGHANQSIENVGVRVIGEGELESCGGGGEGEVQQGD